MKPTPRTWSNCASLRFHLFAQVAHVDIEGWIANKGRTPHGIQVFDVQDFVGMSHKEQQQFKFPECNGARSPLDATFDRIQQQISERNAAGLTAGLLLVAARRSRARTRACSLRLNVWSDSRPPQPREPEPSRPHRRGR